MSHTPALAVLLCLACVLAGCASNNAAPVPPVETPAPGTTVAPGPAQAPAAGAARTLTLVVHGMGCPLCANNVDKQLLKIAGVRSVDVDLGTGSVKVRYAGAAPTKARLARAVADSGYTLVKVEGI
jgi:copper chaperone CopZ